MDICQIFYPGKLPDWSTENYLLDIRGWNPFIERVLVGALQWIHLLNLLLGAYFPTLYQAFVWTINWNLTSMLKR